MLVFLLYFIVFLVIVLGIGALPWSGVSSIKMAIWQWKNPRRLKWHNEIVDIATTFVVGLVQIVLGLVFVFVGYQLLIEMINNF